MDDFLLELEIMSDLFDFGSDKDEGSSSKSSYEREDMRGRGPRAPKVARNPYIGPFSNVYIKNADEQNANDMGSIQDQKSTLAKGFWRRFGISHSSFDSIAKDWDVDGEYRALKRRNSTRRIDTRI
ncbi:unnamed protein product [Cylindrotheca closterium]|uniref:Uncharacterized protein n=1 Tax=Cylindrotheca closterium TaxID=2856 RepID=A0AAD2JIS7_9STRA|nr:unnamed protein product [Cylindrotheca closterium]